MLRSHNLYFQKWRKHVFFILFEQIMLSIAEDFKKISKMVIKDNVPSIDKKTNMDQGNKSEGQIHTIHKCQNVEKQEILANLNQFWQLLQKIIRKLKIRLYRTMYQLLTAKLKWTKYLNLMVNFKVTKATVSCKNLKLVIYCNLHNKLKAKHLNFQK